MCRPVLVLLPGLDGTGLLFEPLVRALPADFPIGIVAYPGDKPMDYQELLPLVLRALPADRPFVLLGESFSGPLAIMAAASRPRGLAGVVLSASFVRNPHPYIPGIMARLVRPGFFRLYPMVSQIKALLGGHGTPGLRELIHAALARVSPEVLAARVRQVLQVDVTGLLPGVVAATPVLYLRAGNDGVVPAANARAILEISPAVREIPIPGPHMLLQTSAEIAARVLGDFLDDCAAAGRGWQPGTAGDVAGEGNGQGGLNVHKYSK